MKMKCKKIRNVEKSVCTAEQKIAYNFAFMWSGTMQRALAEGSPEFVIRDRCFDIEKCVLRSLQDKEFESFNIDAIIVAFRQGFRNYCEKVFIATTYEEIGKAFPIPYEVV